MRLLIDRLVPSQLFLNQSKLERIRLHVNEHGLDSLPPVPVKHLDQQLVLTDGHTRVYVAHELGEEKVNAVWDTEPLDWQLYRLCVLWAKDEGIGHVADLGKRILPADIYIKRWIGRCHQAERQLNELFPGRPMDGPLPDLKTYPQLSF
ncbi:MAG: hypothetical protein ACXAE3_05040 [Candidatus Kariarchaeaceae archaeon]|jgi:hypothetical protein